MDDYGANLRKRSEHARSFRIGMKVLNKKGELRYLKSLIHPSTGQPQDRMVAVLQKEPLPERFEYVTLGEVTKA